MRSQAKAMNYRGVHAVGPGGINCRCCYDYRNNRSRERRLRRSYERREARKITLECLADIEAEREEDFQSYLDERADLYDFEDSLRYGYLEEDYGPEDYCDFRGDYEDFLDSFDN